MHSREMEARAIAIELESGKIWLGGVSMLGSRQKWDCGKKIDLGEQKTGLMLCSIRLATTNPERYPRSRQLKGAQPHFPITKLLHNGYESGACR